MLDISVIWLDIAPLAVSSDCYAINKRPIVLMDIVSCLIISIYRRLRSVSRGVAAEVHWIVWWSLNRRQSDPMMGVSRLVPRHG